MGSPDRHFLVVLGSGSAATSVAMRVRAAGRRVAVVDFRPFGGTCALRGCDPKKVLVGASDALDHVQRLAGKGLDGATRLDWPALAAFKRRFTDPVPAQREQQFADAGIDIVHGKARFTGPHTLEADGTVLEAERILVAVGAQPVPLGIPGEAHLVDNEAFLALESLPPRIVLVGGGYIAAEFSHIAACAGSRVTVLQRGERMLTPFDPDLVGWLMRAFERHGIDVRTRTEVQAVDATADGYRVRARSANGQDLVFDADLVVHAAGRVPALADLALDAGGVAVDDGRLRLDAHLQSVSNPAVYAAGDAAQKGPPLTPVAGHDAEVVADNLLQGNHRRVDYGAVPSVVFTLPPLASVGIGESEARRQGLRVRTVCRDAADWYTARQAAQPTYGFKTLVEQDTDRLLGAHLVGPHADEVINVFALALRHGLTARQLASTLFTYPSGASDIAHML